MSIRSIIILAGLFLTILIDCVAGDSLEFKGQLSSYTLFNTENELCWWSGGRYIPQLNYRYNIREDKLVDLEGSVNLYGNIALKPFDSSKFDGDIKPYRVWARYSTDQFEFRAGLQKINFGSASLLRPLMWFDQIDPRDPLQLTDGVWGALARYYFLNNANLWVWGLVGNTKLKGWEYLETKKNIPEFGGRFQYPVPHGEAALSYHHRVTDCRSLSDSLHQYTYSPENRIGVDIRLDVVIGCWLEASWTHMSEDLGILTDQHIINMGMDYTFGIGNGLSVIFEQLLASYDEEAFQFGNTKNFSLINVTYPLGLFDNISAIAYYDWDNSKVYSFVNWQHQFNKFSLYLMGYVNPKEYYLPAQSTGENLYAGYGVQILFVFNH